MDLASLFSVRTILFSFYGYDMSYLELVGTVFNLWAVWLTANQKTSGWPVGLVAVLLFMVLFYQIQLYSDFFEQIYYFATNVYGWILWSRKNSTDRAPALPITRASHRWIAAAIAITAVGTLLEGSFMARIHQIFPRYFTQPADYPYLDAFTTVLSFVGQIFTAHKKMECWWIWAIVNLLGVWLYFTKGVWLLAILFAIFLGITLKGYLSWRKELGSKA